MATALTMNRCVCSFSLTRRNHCRMRALLFARVCVCVRAMDERERVHLHKSAHTHTRTSIESIRNVTEGRWLSHHTQYTHVAIQFYTAFLCVSHGIILLLCCWRHSPKILRKLRNEIIFVGILCGNEVQVAMLECRWTN